jgi:hypothetical protein
MNPSTCGPLYEETRLTRLHNIFKKTHTEMKMICRSSFMTKYGVTTGSTTNQALTFPYADLPFSQLIGSIDGARVEVAMQQGCLVGEEPLLELLHSPLKRFVLTKAPPPSSR